MNIANIYGNEVLYFPMGLCGGWAHRFSCQEDTGNERGTVEWQQVERFYFLRTQWNVYGFFFFYFVFFSSFSEDLCIPTLLTIPLDLSETVENFVSMCIDIFQKRRGYILRPLIFNILKWLCIIKQHIGFFSVTNVFDK